MAERKAVNKYYPPDWEPTKGSVNRLSNSHPLRSRASKLDQGILVVRFEMPFNIWCSGCKNHIGMGVRYNAEKSKVGNYYSSPIYKFRMKCHLCDNYFEIQTNPSKLDYDVLTGAKKQTVASFETDINETSTGCGTSRTVSDSMARLERKIEDKLKADEHQPNLYELKQWRSRFEDGFRLNQIARKQYRERRKKAEEYKKRDKELLKKASLKIPLVKPSSSDRIEAINLLKQTMTPRLNRIEENKKTSGHQLKHCPIRNEKL